MANVQNLDDLAYSIEYLIRVADDQYYPDLWIVCPVPAQRMLAQLHHGIPNARSHISSANRRAFSQVLNDPLAVGKCARRVTNLHWSWRLSALATKSSDTNLP